MTKKSITKKSIMLAVLFLALLLAGGCDRQSEIQASGEVIKLGVIGPFSGEDRAKGQDGRRGVETAMSLHPLLQNGDKIELLIEDDQNKPSLTVNALIRLATEEQVSAIILMSTTASALEIRSTANELQIPVLAMVATHPDVTKENNYISQLCFDNVFQAAVAALFVMDELLIDRVVVFTNPDSQYSSTLTTEFIRKYQSVSGRIVDTVLVAPDVDYRTKLEELRDKGTELLYLPVKAKEVITIVKAARKLNWYPVIMGSDGLVATVISDYAEDAGLLEGLYAIDFFADNDILIERASFLKKIRKAYKASHKEEATSYTGLGFEGYTIVHNAMNRCTDPGDRTCINRLLRKTKNFEGLAGKISINENGKASRPLVVNTIRGGETKFIVKVY
ncbi:MAG: ABC transporter substrate-binding protein [Arenicellales bacterium]